MASVGNKRPHVLTKRMQEYLCTKRVVTDGEGSGGTRLFRCPRAGCNKVLTSTPGLRYHIKTHDTQVGAFVCIRCKKHFRSYNGLRYHRQQTICEPAMEYSEFDLPPLENSYFTSYPETHDTQNSDIEGLRKLNEEIVGPRPRSWSASEVDYLSSSSGSEMTCDDPTSWLHDLATIATGPRSPLLQPFHDADSPKKIPRYMSSPPHLSPHMMSPPRSSPPPSPYRGLFTDSPAKNSAKSEQSESSASPAYSHEFPDLCPQPEWLCFLKGTRVKLSTVSGWHIVESMETKEDFVKLGFGGEDGLIVSEIEECNCPGDKIYCDKEGHLRLTFTSSQAGGLRLQAECALNHPFFVKDKGWCAVHPELATCTYGMVCERLQVKDVCLHPSHPLTALTKDALHSLSSYDFTPMDSSAVLTLSNMAMQKKEQTLSPIKSSPLSSPSKTKPEQKAKRPMNAFMIFAKRFRMEYMQQYPGKDNRAISVLLGDKWKKMAPDERKTYLTEARHLAEEQKKLHPDCWKRKRTMSASVIE